LLFLAWDHPARREDALYRLQRMAGRVSVWPRDGEAISGVDRGGHGGGGGGRFMRFCLSLSPNDRSRLVSGLGGLGEQGRQGDMSGRLGFAGVRGEGDGSTEPGRWGTWRDRDQLKPALALSPSR
jgi:hypothetical protein